MHLIHQLIQSIMRGVFTMSIRSVYLGHVDIGNDSLLDLRRQGIPFNEWEVLTYIFTYGLIADQVFMQGSAPLKNHQVFLSYLRLLEAFRRNENYEPTPVFSFVLGKDIDGYKKYLAQRLGMVNTHGANNAEQIAYGKNNGINTARKLDADLRLIQVPRRIHPVEAAFRESLIDQLECRGLETQNLHDETIEKTLRQIEQSETIQTFSLIKKLTLTDVEQKLEVYKIARAKYRQANAFGMGAINSDDSPILNFKIILNFFKAIGLIYIFRFPNELSAEILFRLRRLPSFRYLKERYLNCQNKNDTEGLIALLNKLRINGKFKCAIEQSPAAFVAICFETLNESNIGYKSVNKGLELLLKAVVSDAASEYFAQDCYQIFGMLELLKTDMHKICPAPN